MKGAPVSIPVINSVQVVYPQGRSYKFPGEAAEVFVDAVDADGHTITVEVTVRDAQGATVTQQTGVLQGDPLTYEAAVTAPATGHTVTQDPARPNRFVVV